MTSFQKKSGGFTIIETLVAVAILMISVAGPLTIAYKGLSAAFLALDQVTASYLVQDALEYVKNVRDNNILRDTYNNAVPGNWLAGLDSCIWPVGATSGGPHCSVDTINGDSLGTPVNGIITCTTCTLLNLSSGNKAGYNHFSGEPSKFSRYFYIIPNAGIPPDPPNPEEATLIVEVRWMSGKIENVSSYRNEIFKSLR